MRYGIMALMLLGWFAASAFVVWMLWSSGHPVWAGIVAIICAGSPSLKDGK